MKLQQKTTLKFAQIQTHFDQQTRKHKTYTLFLRRSFSFSLSNGVCTVRQIMTPKKKEETNQQTTHAQSLLVPFVPVGGRIRGTESSFLDNAGGNTS